jgi:hypothetical protein
MTPFSEAEKRAAIELWKAGIPLKKTRDLLKMNERGLRNSLPKPPFKIRARVVAGPPKSRYCATWWRVCLTCYWKLSKRGGNTIPTIICVHLMFF